MSIARVRSSAERSERASRGFVADLELDNLPPVRVEATGGDVVVSVAGQEARRLRYHEVRGRAVTVAFEVAREQHVEVGPVLTFLTHALMVCAERAADQ